MQHFQIFIIFQEVHGRGLRKRVCPAPPGTGLARDHQIDEQDELNLGTPTVRMPLRRRRQMPVPAGTSGIGGIPKMNRRYALIALDRHHECADFPGCYLIQLTLTAQWRRGSRGNKVIADRTYTPLREIVEQIVEAAFDQAPSGRLDT